MKHFAVASLAVALMLAPACGKKDEKGGDDQPSSETTKTTQTEPAEPKVDAELVERGKYLANIAGCVLCHTPLGKGGLDMDRMLAGGLEVKEPFGTWRSLNISNHETGIKSWTDEQIIAAVREGVRPDGERLFPIMPYMFYNKMSDDDAKALVAFLRSAPPQDNKVERKTDLKLPTDFPVPEPTGKGPGEDPVERGAYLAAMAHCGACHVPLDEKTHAPDYKRMYAGGMPMELMPPFGEGVIFAPNITPHPETGIGTWSEEDIVGVIKGMKRPDGRPIVFPMALYAQAYTFMSDDDAMAIAKFLKAMEPIENKIPESKYKLTMGGPGGPPGGGEPPAATPAAADKPKGSN